MRTAPPALSLSIRARSAGAYSFRARFPYGDSTAQTLALVGEQGFLAFHWSAVVK